MVVYIHISYYNICGNIEHVAKFQPHVIFCVLWYRSDTQNQLHKFHVVHVHAVNCVLYGFEFILEVSE